MKHSRIGHWEWDFKSGLMTWSDGIFRLLGLEPHSIKPNLQLFMGLVHPADRPHVGLVYSPDRNSEQYLDQEFRILRADGETRWLYCQAEIFAAPDGRPSWAAGVTIDVTEKYVALSQLRYREEKYSALVRATSVAEWSAAPDGTIREASFWSSYTGQTVDEIQGFGWLNAIHADDIATVKAVWEETLRAGTAAELSFRIRRTNGEYRWVHAAGVPLRNEDGSIKEWVGKISDIDDQRKHERALRLSEARLRTALEAGHVSIWEWDPQSDLLTRMGRLTDYRLEVLPFKDVLDQVHPHDRAQLVSTWKLAAENKAPLEHEFRLKRKSGQASWIGIRGAFVPNPFTGTVSLTGVSFEIGRHKKVEAEARLLRGQLEQLLRRQTALYELISGKVWFANALGQVTGLGGRNPSSRVGRSAVEAAELNWLNAVHPEDQERTRMAWQRAVESSTEFSSDHRIRDRNSTYKFFRARAAPVRDEDGLVREWVGVSSEIGSTSGICNGGYHPNGGHPHNGYPTGAQVRAARGLLNLSVRELAEMSGVSVSSIKRIEENTGRSNVAESTLAKLSKTLVAAGVEFDPAGWLRLANKSDLH
ncbi:PAS domain-containing protein [Microvirga sp. M2]|uniref:PAS domain-containing protein n=1 Tax=Microvirga sp. M2 TaxID=3073270 RepID=UPI0039C157EE